MSRTISNTALPALLLGLVCNCASAQTVPPVYQDLYTEMQGAINSFNTATLALWDGSKPPVTFSAHLLTANSNSGPSILTPGNYTSFLHEMDGLKALGVTAVVVNIDYPILDPGFDAFGGQAAAYLGFYQSVANDIHARGLKMIVETGAIFTDPVFSPLNAAAYYGTLTFPTYSAGRAAQAALIASAINPDYLNVVEEPDTEALQTGFTDVYTLTGSLNLLTGIIGAVRASGSAVSLGAGIGTWLSNDSTGKSYTDYISAYAATPGLDKIDVHVYPVIKDFLPRLNTIASLAAGANKRMTMTEAWDYKERDSELNNPAFPASLLFSRDVFSFWAPVDAQFLQAITNWCYYQNLEFAAVFWSDYLRAYITYDTTTQSLPPAQLFSLAETAAGAAITTPAVTSTGTSWYNFIVNPADLTPPGAPVVTPTLYPNQVVLNWPPSTDNVGVYRYTVSRSGVPSTTTVDPVFTEANLVSCGKYVYTVTALDFKNNKASTTTPTLTTPDNVPPQPPTATTVTAGPVVRGTPTTTSMNVTWSGATDNCGPSGIAGYIVNRSVGSNAGPWTALKQVAATPRSYTDSGLQKSATLYCYKLNTVDAVQLKSTDGPVSCATSKDFQPPTVPTGLTAVMGAAPNVTLSWNPSTDDVAVAGYDVQRRRGTSGAFTIIKTGIPTPSYLDPTAYPLPDTVPPTVSIVSPASGATLSKKVVFQASAADKGVYTTYTYQVRAVDTSQNKSAFGTPGTITWPVVGGKVASVAFFVDGVQVGLLTAAPYYILWDSTTVPNGSHAFTAKATDTAGNNTLSLAVTATVAN